MTYRFKVIVEHPDGVRETIFSPVNEDMSPLERIVKANEIIEASLHVPPGTKIYLTIRSKANEPRK